MAVLVGKPAPDFICPAVLANGELVENFHLASAVCQRYALLFFYPLDFSPSSCAALHALNNHIDALLSRDVVVIGISVDSHLTHQAWRNTTIANNGLGSVRFTLAADITQQIMRNYDVQTDAGSAFFSTFLIDTRGIVRSQMVHDQPLTSNMDELLRLIDQLQSTPMNTPQ